MFSCSIVKKKTAKLIHILKEAGLLVMGDTIEMFLFVDYDFNSIENLILITMSIKQGLVQRNTQYACLLNTLNIELITLR